MTRDELVALPKVELHCHLDGSLSRNFIEKRLGRKVSQEELSVSDDCRSLNEYLEKFDLPGQCLMDEEGLREAGYDVLRSMYQENVCYAEVRFAPLLSETSDMDCRKVIEAVIAGMNKGKQDFGVEYGIITCPCVITAQRRICGCSKLSENTWVTVSVQQIWLGQRHCILCLNLWMYLRL